MILPNELDPIAKLAYEKFIKKFPRNPTWEGVSLPGKTAWRDRVFDADKARRSPEPANHEDKCCLEAILDWEKGADQRAAETLRRDAAQVRQPRVVTASDPSLGVISPAHVETHTEPKVPDTTKLKKEK